jgi:ribosomal protein S18 acetylase RimI-like enzyme
MDEKKHQMIQTEITVRHLTIEDTPKIAEICVECLPAAQNYSSHFYENLVNEERGRCRGAFHKGKLIALVACCLSNYKNSSLQNLHLLESQNEQQMICYISVLCVKKEYRRNGLATHLMKKTENFCKSKDDVKFIYLHVSVSNEEALDFYKKQRFKIVGTDDTYYSDTIDENPAAFILVFNFD